MTFACELLARTPWVEEDTTALSLAADASVLGATWLADQWSFLQPREGTQFSCALSRPEHSIVITTAETGAPSQNRWGPYVKDGMLTTLVVRPWTTSYSSSSVVIEPAPLVHFPATSLAAVTELPSRPWSRGALEEVTPDRQANDRTAAAASTPLEIALQLRRDLNLTWNDMEAATGIDRNTLLNWQRTGAVPRPSTVRKLMRVHGLVHALESMFGRDKSSAWLHGGQPSWIDVLKSGNLQAFASAVTTVLDSIAGRESGFFAYRPGPEEEESVSAPPRRQFKASDRTPTRSRLPRKHD
jgi:transcriptional regulator with XRE-family HTH domain